MLGAFLVVVVAFTVWLQWRAAYTAEVRTLLAELADGAPMAGADLGELIGDLRDKRLAFRCKAVLADRRAGDSDLFSEHVADALERVAHLERFAPGRLLRARRP